METVKPIAELIMECGMNEGDYYKSVVADLYMKYFRNRKIQAFKSMFSPEYKLILALDCAPYHVRRTGFTLKSASKPEVIAWHDECKIKWIKVRRFGKKHGPRGKVFKFKRIEFQPPAPRGASKNESLLWLYRWCQKHKPNALELDLDVEMQKNGYPPILWNVPNHPQYIAKEFVNACVKSDVKKKVKHNRTMPQLRKHILGGFYGDEDSNKCVHEAITPELCAMWFAHCEMEINEGQTAAWLTIRLMARLWLTSIVLGSLAARLQLNFLSRH